jgi:hypothetical protein
VASSLEAIMVSVDYWDILSVTLPWNQQHFSRILLCTTPGSKDSEVARAHGAEVFETDAFYRRPMPDGSFQQDKSLFRKWLGLNEAVDHFNPQGWVALIDADVLWPKSLDIREAGNHLVLRSWPVPSYVQRGQLCGPFRRMAPWPLPDGIPPEIRWSRYPFHPQQREWAGFSLVFHAEDPVLNRPWFDGSWSSCSGGDSEFQARWHPRDKIRPPWSVLHLGSDHVNWRGRVQPYRDGSSPQEASLRRAALRDMMVERRRSGGFRAEKL